MPQNIRFVLIPATPFDGSEWPLAIAAAYMLRGIVTLYILPRLPRFDYLHTPTDIISDVLPAYVFRRQEFTLFWTARFFHFYASPFERHGSVITNSGSYLLQRFSLSLIKSADLVMVDNPLISGELTNQGFSARRLELHPGGVDVKTFRSVTLSKSVPQTDALFIGRLSPHKGVYDTVPVWQEVIKRIPHARLGFIGYGPPETLAKLTEMVERAGLQTSITNFGFIHDRKTLAQYLHRTKLLLFLDHEAGFGLVVAEALSCGVPVVAYDLPFIDKLFKQSLTVVPLKNYPAVAGAVISLLNDKHKYQDLKREGEKQADQFDWSHVSQKFYNSLTNTQ